MPLAFVKVSNGVAEHCPSVKISMYTSVGGGLDRLIWYVSVSVLPSSTNTPSSSSTTMPAMKMLMLALSVPASPDPVLPLSFTVMLNVTISPGVSAGSGVKVKPLSTSLMHPSSPLRVNVPSEPSVSPVAQPVSMPKVPSVGGTVTVKVRAPFPASISLTLMVVKVYATPGGVDT